MSDALSKHRLRGSFSKDLEAGADCEGLGVGDLEAGEEDGLAVVIGNDLGGLVFVEVGLHLRELDVDSRCHLGCGGFG